MAQQKKAVVITTINPPNEALRAIVKTARGWDVVVVGDRKTPPTWQLDGARYISIAAQQAMDSAFAAKCPFNHYARKNLGYLQAIRDGCAIIAETDDDNLPYENWLKAIDRSVSGRPVQRQGWENVYRHFSRERIWPRGLPLEHVAESFTADESLGAAAKFDCPIQQYLADDNPDVDAVYRLVLGTPVKFTGGYIILREGTFCPFNSQNTIWWPEAFELLYLPAFVSFRMTDIWRSFIAQVCLYRMGKPLCFGAATMYQIRNVHNLLRDFADEVPGYLNNVKIMDTLTALDLSSAPAPGTVGDNLLRCYEALIAENFVPKEELALVQAWLTDVRAAKPRHKLAASRQ